MPPKKEKELEEKKRERGEVSIHRLIIGLE